MPVVAINVSTKLVKHSKIFEIEGVERSAAMAYYSKAVNFI
jgi:hypothetical protein